MAEDYLTDDEQLEEVKRFLKENGPWIIGGILVGVGILAGYRWYQGHTNQTALQAAAAFAAVTNALEANDGNKSRQLAQGVIGAYAGSPYADQARLVLARIDVEEGKLDQAVAPLGEVMGNAKDPELRNVARLRLARVQIALSKPDEALKTLAEPIPTGFAQPYHEARGDAYAAKKNAATAIGEYQAALAAGDPASTAGSLIGLKIQDLGGAPAPLAPTAANESQPKAKP